jgi:hypothetical protein
MSRDLDSNTQLAALRRDKKIKIKAGEYSAKRAMN